MDGRGRVLGEVARDPRNLRVVVSLGLFAMAEQASWIAILVYAYAAGGAALAAIAAVAQEVPTAIAAPFLALLGDRRRDLALPLGYAAQAITLGLAAVALAVGAPISVVIAIAAVAMAALSIARPAHAAVLPCIARTPEGLTAANVASGFFTNVGNFTGPAVAAVCLRLAGPATAFSVAAAAVAIAAFLCIRVVRREDIEASRPGVAATPAIVWRETREGIAALGGDAYVRVTSLTVASCAVIVGALEILLVAAADDLLTLGRGGGGYLNALVGLGGIAGAALTVSLIGRRRLAPAIALGNLGLGLALVAAAGLPTALAVSAFVFVAGASTSFTTVAAQTLLQRTIPDRLRARGFGALEAMLTLALAFGAVSASLLLTVVGPRLALAAAGAIPVVALLVGFSRLSATDRAAPAPDPLRTALLRRIPMFAPLPPLELERVAADMRPLEVGAGETVIRQGDVGDRFYVAVAGELAITKDGTEVARCEAGGYFGEIALLRDVPRTATVTAVADSVLLGLDRAPFLEAVTGHARSREAAEGIADERLRDDPDGVLR